MAACRGDAAADPVRAADDVAPVLLREVLDAERRRDAEVDRLAGARRACAARAARARPGSRRRSRCAKRSSTGPGATRRSPARCTSPWRSSAPTRREVVDFGRPELVGELTDAERPVRLDDADEQLRRAVDRLCPGLGGHLSHMVERQFHGCQARVSVAPPVQPCPPGRRTATVAATRLVSPALSGASRRSAFSASGIDFPMPRVAFDTRAAGTSVASSKNELRTCSPPARSSPATSSETVTEGAPASSPDRLYEQRGHVDDLELRAGRAHAVVEHDGAERAGDGERLRARPGGLVTRASLIALPRSSIHMWAPPAPQQNVRLPLRAISTRLADGVDQLARLLAHVVVAGEVAGVVVGDRALARLRLSLPSRTSSASSSVWCITS